MTSLLLALLACTPQPKASTPTVTVYGTLVSSKAVPTRKHQPMGAPPRQDLLLTVDVDRMEDGGQAVPESRWTGWTTRQEGEYRVFTLTRERLPTLQAGAPIELQVRELGRLTAEPVQR